MKAHDLLSVYRVVDVPLREVSGVCLGRGADGVGRRQARHNLILFEPPIAAA